MAIDVPAPASASAWKTAAGAAYWMVVGAAVMLLILDWGGMLKKGGCDCEETPAVADDAYRRGVAAGRDAERDEPEAGA